MTTATWPLSMELSTLTMRMRQVQRMSRDRARRMRPTARSERFTLTKRCVPGEREEDALPLRYPLYVCRSEIPRVTWRTNKNCLC